MGDNVVSVPSAAATDVAAVREDWEQLASSDPLWAVLTDPASRHHGWDLEELFASGLAEADYTIEMLDDLGLCTRRNRALDFGCGVGRVTQALAGYFRSVVGVDVSAEMVRLAQELDPGDLDIAFVLNTASDLGQFADRSFDLVFSKLVLQHVPPKLAQQYLRELGRLVAPGGALVVQLPSRFRRNVPLPADAYRARITCTGLPTRLRAGREVSVSVTVANWSRHLWRCTESQLAIGAYWVSHDDERLPAEEARALLACDLEPGASATTELRVPPPHTVGRCRLLVDVVHEGVTWFGDHAGSALRLPVRVVHRPLPQRVAGRVKRLVTRAQPADVAPAGSTETPMTMNGVDEHVVAEILEGSGLRIVRRDRDHAAPGWRSYTYYATR